MAASGAGLDDIVRLLLPSSDIDAIGHKVRQSSHARAAWRVVASLFQIMQLPGRMCARCRQTPVVGLTDMMGCWFFRAGR